jgi:hypothetical protein
MLATVLLVAAGGAATVTAVSRSANSLGSSSPPTSMPSTSQPAYLAAPLVQQLASNNGVQDLKVLISADSGQPGNSSAVIVGTNGAGQSCWTVVGGGGGIGSPFRCGSQPGHDQGEPADQEVLRAGCDTSGGRGSATADAASCIGFVGSNVATVEVNLTGGSSHTLTVTDGAFAYAADTSGLLPTSFVAYGASGQVLARQDIILASSLGN